MLTRLCTCCFCPTWPNVVAISVFIVAKYAEKFEIILKRDCGSFFVGVFKCLREAIFGPFGHMLAKEETEKKWRKHCESEIKQLEKGLKRTIQKFETRVSKKWLFNFRRAGDGVRHSSRFCIASLLIRLMTWKQFYMIFWFKLSLSASF